MKIGNREIGPSHPITRRSFLATLVCVPFAARLLKSKQPEGKSLAARFAQQYNMETDAKPSRLDILFGEATLQTRYAWRWVPHGRYRRQWRKSLRAKVNL